MDLKLKDSVVIVTGGTGDIGREIVSSFHSEGAEVYFTFNRAENKAAAMVEEFGSERVHARQVSVTDRKGMEDFAREVYKESGRIDILVNNAGIAQVLPFPLIEEEEWKEVMDVNVTGTFIATREIARFMIREKRGSIINVGSLAGERIMEVPVHYATSKAAITGFTLSLAKEFSRYNIRVNCVVPGLIDGGVGRNTPEKQKSDYLHFCTLGRLGKPVEVADLIVYLASERAGFVNGQIIHIDGGI
ncbi:MAG: 3-oxoacyl-ACP reductase [Candidatus Wallbacteria bacterium HGW-Wallbacteria-1]|jgi:NAD(P)-dependent dehydrogenase (short-subunit alcohol dehydrogenase family)|uniref:3-oxoacyl-ACP reductase n=1 Tax=Candidatus Wallbacteria bacterium HGW-Wallbacteria-1 TaxID=2013854 RepID=A0A2N1PU60_9BACT|nr:MAG: 3-oxoacyl-ACP reductase [Candidatus Wallbacteria bacterium HGW-Wallbacteria-1]